MNKYNIVMEYFYLLLAIGTSIYAVYQYINFPEQVDMLLFVLPVVAVIMFWIRRFYRKKQEARNNS